VAKDDPASAASSGVNRCFNTTVTCTQEHTSRTAQHCALTGPYDQLPYGREAPYL
jgi:hypothetical protein